MFARLFILFAVLPILEIMLLINVSERIGGWNTFTIVLLTAFFGAYFVRKEGVSTLNSVQQKMASGQMPGKETGEGLLLLIAGVLLVTPGFITDIIGLAFTLPFSRSWIADRLISWFARQPNFHSNVNFQQSTYSQQAHREDSSDVIDGEYAEKNTDEQNEQNKNRLN